MSQHPTENDIELDKYTAIPGEMDTIDCLRKERDELKAEREELEKELFQVKQMYSNAKTVSENHSAAITSQANEIQNLKESLRREREKFEKIEEFVSHDPDCILNFWEAGEPTPDGGYRSKYAGKWYQSKPIDETPKCNCGLQEFLESYQKDVIEIGSFTDEIKTNPSMKEGEWNLANKKEYQHDIFCSGDRTKPIGTSGSGCSCMGRLRRGIGSTAIDGKDASEQKIKTDSRVLSMRRESDMAGGEGKI